MNIHFKTLVVAEWQQFKNVSIDFHHRLTILTGANGSGKTTLLNLLARHSGWNLPSLATPNYDEKSGVVAYLARLFDGQNRSSDPTIGHIGYSTGARAGISVPNSSSAQYQINLSNTQPVQCFFIPSHRLVYRYQPLAHIPTSKKNKHTAFTEVSNVVRQRYTAGSEQQSGSFLMKNALVSWAIQGYGVKSGNKTIMPSDSEQIANYEGFQRVLRKVLPKSLGFQGLEIRNMEVVFVCNEGRDEFLLETVSGGVSALIDMAWQIYMFCTNEKPSPTVLIDEVENHLHPTMQRQVLLDLLSAFPQVRFIVSTHSPLVVGSVQDSFVYALAYDETGKIVSQKLDFQKRAKTASQILDEVLGVSVTIPIWAERLLAEIVDRHVRRGLSEDSFAEMRTELSQAGLDQFFPLALQRTLEGTGD